MALPPGLPCVPAPLRDELLGAWLLRVAQLYGLGLAALVARLTFQRHTGSALPHWYALRGAHVDAALLTKALRTSPRELFAMSPPSCQRYWPRELGVCTQCLEQAELDGEPVTWSRRWMHPMATGCAVHRIWLTPVATSTMRRIRQVGEFRSCCNQPDGAQKIAGEEPDDLVEDALWLQRRCQQRSSFEAPWGHSFPEEFSRIADTLARVFMTADARLEPPTLQRFGFRGEPFKIFTVEGSGRRLHWILPSRLRHRQRLLGEVGALMRLGPSAKTTVSLEVARQLENECPRNLSAALLQWICPQAAVGIKRAREMQAGFDVVPRYVRA